jgi:hypothetical protein
MPLRAIGRIATIAIFAALWLGAPAYAGACGPRAAIVAQLEAKYQERRIVTGVLGNEDKFMMELFVSRTGTWTIIWTDANKFSCITSAGSALMREPEA